MNNLFYITGIVARIVAVIVFIQILFSDGSLVFEDVTNRLLFVVIMTQIGTYLKEDWK
jgi:hypothetical protein